MLQCQRQTGNRHNPHAVARTLTDGRVVGHMPRNISPVCSIFIRRGGSITCTVSDRRRYSADLEQGGLEIPCKIKFSTSSSVEKDSEKAEKLVTTALSNNETNGLSKFLVGKFLANQCNFAKFAKIFHHQKFALYGTILVRSLVYLV